MIDRTSCTIEAEVIEALASAVQDCYITWIVCSPCCEDVWIVLPQDIPSHVDILDASLLGIPPPQIFQYLNAPNQISSSLSELVMFR